MTVNHPPYHVGIDVSRDQLDVYCLEQDHYFQVENNERGIAQLIQQLPTPAKVLVEATGKLERPAAIALDKQGYHVCIVNPKQTYHYSKSKGILAKTDRIDARSLAIFAKETAELRFEIPSKKQFQWIDYQKRRDQLKKLIIQEKNRLKRQTDAWLKGKMQQHIQRLEKDLSQVEVRLKEMIKANAAAKSTYELLQSIPGIGETIALTVVAALPELGKINKKAIAKLAGLAPIAHDSGRKSGRRSIQGGRQNVRNALYMGALVGIRYNKSIQQYYDALLKKGKMKKVALVACMHKLLRMMHSVVLKQKAFEYVSEQT